MLWRFGKFTISDSISLPSKKRKIKIQLKYDFSFGVKSEMSESLCVYLGLEDCSEWSGEEKKNALTQNEAGE